MPSSPDSAELIGRVAEDGGDPAGVLTRVVDVSAEDVLGPNATDRDRGIGFLDVDRFVLPVSSQPCREPISGVEQPSIAGFGGEQDQLTDGNDAAVVIGSPALNIAHLIGHTKTLALDDPLARSTPDRFSTASGPGDCHGNVHPAVWRSAGLRLPLLRPHCHLRLPQRAVAARAGGALLPERGRPCGGGQRGLEPAHRRLPGLGGSLRPQSSAADRMGREGRAQGRPCPGLATPHGQGRRLRRLLHLQEHGAGAELPRQRPQIRHQEPALAKAGDANYRILARQRSRFTHYYFYLRDETLGPMVMWVASFFPFQTTYYLNGHSFIEQELKRAQIGFRKTDNAFLAVDDVTALQAAADKLNPDIIRQRLDYWTLILGPKFSAKERKQLNLSRFYASAQIEYCPNFIFKRNFPIHKLFERGCELGLWRLTGDKIAEIFGTRLNRRMRGKPATPLRPPAHG